MKIRDALAFYADEDSYTRQPVMAETMGGWIPEDVPEDHRDDYCGIAMARAVDGDETPVGPAFMEPHSEGAIQHTIHEPQMWGERPALADAGAKAREALAALDDQEGMRGAFEEWVRRERQDIIQAAGFYADGPFTRNGEGYMRTSLNALWSAWQAAYRQIGGGDA